MKKYLSRLDTAQGKRLVLFMVGMTNPTETGVYHEMEERNLPDEWKKRFEVFYLRGDQLFSKMSGMHRLMMRMPKAEAKKKPESERTEDDKRLIENFGSDIVYASKEQIEPILQSLIKE